MTQLLPPQALMINSSEQIRMDSRLLVLPFEIRDKILKLVLGDRCVHVILFSIDGLPEANLDYGGESEKEHLVTYLDPSYRT